MGLVGANYETLILPTQTVDYQNECMCRLGQVTCVKKFGRQERILRTKFRETRYLIAVVQLSEIFLQKSAENGGGAW